MLLLICCLFACDLDLFGTNGNPQNKADAAQKGKKFTSDRNIIGLLGLQQDKKTKKDTLGN